MKPKNRSIWKLGLILGLAFCVCGPFTETKAATFGWDEEYTDTDMAKGTLALRCSVFQGFQGEVTVRLLRDGSVSEVSSQFMKNGNYMENLILGTGYYRVSSITAISGSREYECRAEPLLLLVEAGKTARCKIIVAPDGVQRFPVENEKTAAMQTDAKETDAKETEERAGGASDEKGQEEELDTKLWDKAQTEAGRSGLSVLVVVSLTGILMGAGGLLWLLKNKRTGDG